MWVVKYFEDKVVFVYDNELIKILFDFIEGQTNSVWSEVSVLTIKTFFFSSLLSQTDTKGKVRHVIKLLWLIKYIFVIFLVWLP